jgi:membrane-associated phospholipid phosphatase
VSPRSAALVVAAAYAALTALVAAGAISGLDRWSVEHLMPAADFRRGERPFVDALVPLLHQRWTPALAAVANVVTLPAGAVVSLLVLTACSIVLRRRGRQAEALAWPALWVAGNAVELLCKSVVARPALYDGALHIAAFDSSLPSGHALRAVLVAGAVAAVWPRGYALLAVWALASIVLLQAAGWHTPTDLAAGVLLGALGLLGARAAGALRCRGARART